MAVRRINNTHALPPDAVMVKFPRSDGSSGTWPPETERKIDKEGNVNYFRPVPLNEGLAIHWRRSVGVKVAEELGLPGMGGCRVFILRTYLTTVKSGRRMFWSHFRMATNCLITIRAKPIARGTIPTYLVRVVLRLRIL